MSVFLDARDQLWDARFSVALHFSRASHEHPAADPVDVWVVREAAPVASETNAEHNRERLDDPKG
ncbi:MAG: hypothetical protein JNM89_03600 [Hyphomicrobiaceae bacterium]|nr:hypothetical protein [Hyphomicrobiaceae bacterium]